MLNRKVKIAAHPSPSRPNIASGHKNHFSSTQLPTWTHALGNQPATSLTPLPLAVQRQPKSTTQTQKPKTLNDMGISARDPVAKNTPGIIDDVFKRNKTVATYIADRLTQGREIAEKDKFIVHNKKDDFDKAYEKYAGQKPDASTTGFFWETEKIGKAIKVRDEIHLPPDATFGTAFHEAVHKMSAVISSYLSDDPDFAFVVNEGLTSWFSKRILEDEGVNDYLDGYSRQRKRADKLINSTGFFDPVAKWYWKGERTDLLKKLGIKANSQDESKQVIKELKKIM